MEKKKKGFTLVELLAVIVILAVILVIAIPQIVNTIDTARLKSIESSAKLVATNAEKDYLSNQTLNPNYNVESMDCDDVVKLDSNEYDSCSITFDNNGKATITLTGKDNSKFSGYICNGTKDSMHCEKVTGVLLTVNLDNGTIATDYNGIYAPNTELTLEEPTRLGYEFIGWELVSGDAIINANKITIGNAASIIKAKWNIITYTITYYLNGGVVKKPNPTTYNIETETFTLNNPTGIDFRGWRDGSPVGTPQLIITIEKGSTGDKIYYAQFGDVHSGGSN